MNDNNNNDNKKKRIWVDRKNPNVPNSNMTTTKLLTTIQPNRCYRIMMGIPVIQRKFPGYERPRFIQKYLPGIKSTKLKGFWIDKTLDEIIEEEHTKIFFNQKNNENNENINNENINENNEKNEKISDNNILGKNGILRCSKKTYELQAVVANRDNLAHYNCELLTDEDIFTLQTNEKMPFMEMNIGENYINDYIMNRNLGGGIYLEYHSLPHIHFNPYPTNDGYLIIGHLIDSNLFELTAFKIPYNTGIYMPPSIVHNDCFLIGNYNVMYDIAPLYSTVLLREKKTKELVNFIIHPPKNLNIMDELD
jgi:hypothetical protein